MEDDVGRRIWGEPGSYPAQDTVKLTVFVGFHESFLQSKADEETSNEINERSCEGKEKRRDQSECIIPWTRVLNYEANTWVVAHPV